MSAPSRSQTSQERNFLEINRRAVADFQRKKNQTAQRNRRSHSQMNRTGSRTPRSQPSRRSKSVAGNHIQNLDLPPTPTHIPEGSEVHQSPQTEVRSHPTYNEQAPTTPIREYTQSYDPQNATPSITPIMSRVTPNPTTSVPKSLGEISEHLSENIASHGTSRPSRTSRATATPDEGKSIRSSRGYEGDKEQHSHSSQDHLVAQTPPQSTLFATASERQGSSHSTPEFNEGTTTPDPIQASSTQQTHISLYLTPVQTHVNSANQQWISDYSQQVLRESIRYGSSFDRRGSQLSMMSLQSETVPNTDASALGEENTTPASDPISQIGTLPILEDPEELSQSENLHHIPSIATSAPKSKSGIGSRSAAMTPRASTQRSSPGRRMDELALNPSKAPSPEPSISSERFLTRRSTLSGSDTPRQQSTNSQALVQTSRRRSSRTLSKSPSINTRRSSRSGQSPTPEATSRRSSKTPSKSPTLRSQKSRKSSPSPTPAVASSHQSMNPYQTPTVRTPTSQRSRKESSSPTPQVATPRASNTPTNHSAKTSQRSARSQFTAKSPTSDLSARNTPAKNSAIATPKTSQSRKSIINTRRSSRNQSPAPEASSQIESRISTPKSTSRRSILSTNNEPEAQTTMTPSPTASKISQRLRSDKENINAPNTPMSQKSSQPRYLQNTASSLAKSRPGTPVSRRSVSGNSRGSRRSSKSRVSTAEEGQQEQLYFPEPIATVPVNPMTTVNQTPSVAVAESPYVMARLQAQLMRSTPDQTYHTSWTDLRDITSERVMETPSSFQETATPGVDRTPQTSQVNSVYATPVSRMRGGTTDNLNETYESLWFTPPESVTAENSPETLETTTMTPSANGQPIEFTLSAEPRTSTPIQATPDFLMSSSPGPTPEFNAVSGQQSTEIKQSAEPTRAQGTSMVTSLPTPPSFLVSPSTGPTPEINEAPRQQPVYVQMRSFGTSPLQFENTSINSQSATPSSPSQQEHTEVSKSQPTPELWSPFLVDTQDQIVLECELYQNPSQDPPHAPSMVVSADRIAEVYPTKNFPTSTPVVYDPTKSAQQVSSQAPLQTNPEPGSTIMQEAVLSQAAFQTALPAGSAFEQEIHSQVVNPTANFQPGVALPQEFQSSQIELQATSQPSANSSVNSQETSEPVQTAFILEATTLQKQPMAAAEEISQLQLATLQDSVEQLHHQSPQSLYATPDNKRTDTSDVLMSTGRSSLHLENSYIKNLGSHQLGPQTPSLFSQASSVTLGSDDTPDDSFMKRIELESNEIAEEPDLDEESGEEKQSPIAGRLYGQLDVELSGDGVQSPVVSILREVTEQNADYPQSPLISSQREVPGLPVKFGDTQHTPDLSPLRSLSPSVLPEPIDDSEPESPEPIRRSKRLAKLREEKALEPQESRSQSSIKNRRKVDEQRKSETPEPPQKTKRKAKTSTLKKRQAARKNPKTLVPPLMTEEAKPQVLTRKASARKQNPPEQSEPMEVEKSKANPRKRARSPPVAVNQPQETVPIEEQKPVRRGRQRKNVDSFEKKEATNVLSAPKNVKRPTTRKQLSKSPPPANPESAQNPPEESKNNRKQAAKNPPKIRQESSARGRRRRAPTPGVKMLMPMKSPVLPRPVKKPIPPPESEKEWRERLRRETKHLMLDKTEENMLKNHQMWDIDFKLVIKAKRSHEESSMPKRKNRRA